MTDRGYEEVDHTAEWSLRVWAPNMTELFIQAAQSMLALVEVRPERRSQGSWREIELEAPDFETLLVDWLHELLYALETRYVTCAELDLQVEESPALKGRILEVPAPRPKKHIKAVTYHELNIEKRNGRLETVIVFDV